MKRSLKKLTALFITVLALSAVLMVPASAAWGEFTRMDGVTLDKKNSAVGYVYFEFKGDGIDSLKVSSMGTDYAGNPASVVRVSLPRGWVHWSKAGDTCWGTMKIEALQQGNATITLKMRNNNGLYLGDSSIKSFSLSVDGVA